MSLDKAVKHGKEHRRPYRRSQRFDVTCRPHGFGRAHPCPYCEANRRHADLKARGLADILLKEATDS